MDGLSRTVALGQIAIGGAASQNPRNGTQNCSLLAVIASASLLNSFAFRRGEVEERFWTWGCLMKSQRLGLFAILLVMMPDFWGCAGSPKIVVHVDPSADKEDDRSARYLSIGDNVRIYMKN